MYGYYGIRRFYLAIDLLGVWLIYTGLKSLLSVKQDSYDSESRSTNLVSSFAMLIIGGLLLARHFVHFTVPH